VLFSGPGQDFIYAVENSKNRGQDTVKGGRDNDFVAAIDKTRDVLDCGGGSRDWVYYDKNADRVENCEIKRTKLPKEEGFGTASSGMAEKVHTDRAR
jgi:hypothetical protein